MVRGVVTVKIDFGAFEPLNLTSGGNILNDFPENQLPKFHPVPSRLGGLAWFPLIWKISGILLIWKSPGRLLEFYVRPGICSVDKSIYAGFDTVTAVLRKSYFVTL